MRRLAERYDDKTIAAILSKQKRTTGTGLSFTKTRVKSLRVSRAIPAYTPPVDVPPEDDDVQYTSAEFTALLAQHDIAQSLSRPRQCWDNAVAEAWFATLKLELIDRQSWATRAQVRRAVFEFVEVFYNRKRLHSSLGFLSRSTTRRRGSTTTRTLWRHNQAVRRGGSTPR